MPPVGSLPQIVFKMGCSPPAVLDITESTGARVPTFRSGETGDLRFRNKAVVRDDMSNVSRESHTAIIVLDGMLTSLSSAHVFRPSSVNTALWR